MQFLNKRELQLTPVFVVISTLLQLLLLLIVFGQASQITKIANRKAPTLVELQNGNSVRVAAQESNYRSPQVIKNFVGRTMVGLMEWTGTLPPVSVEQAKNPLPDPGVTVGERKIATSTRDAAFALSEDFRPTFVEQIALLTPQEVFRRGKIQSNLVVRYISEPEPIGEKIGKWRLDLVANLVSFEGGDEAVGKAIPFNKTIFVRAVDTPSISPGASALQQAEYRARIAGLEMYQVQDLHLEN